MRLVPVLAGVLLASSLSRAAPAAGADPATANLAAPVLIGSAGVFALLDDEFADRLLLGLQYRGAPRTSWSLRPGVGVLGGEDGMSYLYADLARDFALPRRWIATLSFGFGWFNNGDRIEVVDAREFQTVLAVSRQLGRGTRIGLSASHVSNGGWSSPNQGTETLALFVALPFSRWR